MEQIVRIFEEHFGTWHITLPKSSIENCASGHIQKAGWLIQYCFGRDERGEFLDYYACHHMTDDWHRRIRDDGSVENLPTISTWSRWSDDPVEQKKIRDELTARNRKVEQMLLDKGFTFETINMRIGTGRVGDDDQEA